MADLKAVARVVRWATGSMVHNLKQLPPDKLDWKPTPEAKSALQVTGEVAGVMRSFEPLFAGGKFEAQPLPQPTTLEEATSMLTEASEAYAAALDAAGDELERSVESPFGEMWAAHSVLFGMIDLLHHHGQITYIQSLLGDAEMHFEMPAIGQWFGPPPAGQPEPAA